MQRADRAAVLGGVRDHAIGAEDHLARKAAHRLVGRVDVDDAEIGCLKDRGKWRVPEQMDARMKTLTEPSSAATVDTCTYWLRSSIALSR